MYTYMYANVYIYVGIFVGKKYHLSMKKIYIYLEIYCLKHGDITARFIQILRTTGPIMR